MTKTIKTGVFGIEVTVCGDGSGKITGTGWSRLDKLIAV